jgi:F420-non-reducing hydrogenase large subunit
MKRITIDPITRLEGHGKIEIFLNEEGDVANTYFQVPELRGFERFCVGRPVEEMPLLTNRICGVCPEAHHMAAAKAADAVYHVDPPRPAKLLRELLYSGFYFTDHTTHFYALAGPDFVMGPEAPVAERNILGVIHKVGLEIGGKVIQARKHGHEIIEMIGGRKVHPCTSIPGGMTKGITQEQRAHIAEIGTWAVDFAQFTLQLFNDLVLGNKEYGNTPTSSSATSIIIARTTSGWWTRTTRSTSTMGRSVSSLLMESASASTHRPSIRTGSRSGWSRGPTSSSRTSRRSAGKAWSTAWTQVSIALHPSHG